MQKSNNTGGDDEDDSGRGLCGEDHHLFFALNALPHGPLQHDKFLYQSQQGKESQ